MGGSLGLWREDVEGVAALVLDSRGTRRHSAEIKDHGSRRMPFDIVPLVAKLALERAERANGTRHYEFGTHCAVRFADLHGARSHALVAERS